MCSAGVIASCDTAGLASLVAFFFPFLTLTPESAPGSRVGGDKSEKAAKAQSHTLNIRGRRQMGHALHLPEKSTSQSCTVLWSRLDRDP